jgi:hypothetical protein
MPKPPSAYDLHQQSRWLRHDAHLWLRHDFARWLKPGTDPEEVYPHLKRQRQAAEDAERAAVIAESYHLQAVLRAEVDELKAELKRRRLEEAKYSPDQPRIPKRNPGGGQWTRIGGGIGQSPSSNVAQPMGNVDVGDVTTLSELDRPRNVRAGELDVAARGNEAECDLQYKRDKLICNLVRTYLCWAQAAERYAACLSGRPIPQLRF